MDDVTRKALEEVAAGRVEQFSIDELEDIGLTDVTSNAGRTDDDTLMQQAQELLDETAEPERPERPTIARVSWEEAQQMAKRAPERGFMPSASPIEIALPDIAGTIHDIRYFGVVPHELRYAYHRARGAAFAYGGDERREAAERLLDEIMAAAIPTR